jgi:hypothetical protein
MEGCGYGLKKVLSEYLPEETEENHETPVMIASVPADIRTKYLPNMTLQSFCYTSLFWCICCIALI